MVDRVFTRIGTAYNRRKLLEVIDQKKYPLHYYVKTMEPESLLDAIKNGADINQQDEDGYTPLILAVRLGTFEIVCMLLYYGADATIACKNNISPFMHSIFRMDRDIQEQLFQYETDFNRMTFTENLNMLDLAIVKMSPHVVEIARKNVDNIYSEDCVIDNLFILCLARGTDETFKCLWDSIDNKKRRFHICCKGILEQSLIRCRYNIFKYIIESEKLEYVLDELGQSAITFILQRIRDSSEKDFYENSIYVLMSYGFPLKINDLEIIYLIRGDCQLFRNLLYMNITDITQSIEPIRHISWDYQYNDMALLLTYIICYIQPGVTVKDVIRRYWRLSCRNYASQTVRFFSPRCKSYFEITNMRLFLDYCVDYHSFQEFIKFAEDEWYYIGNEMLLKLKRNVPSLLELSRNAFRYAACTKFNMTSASQFYTYVNSLHIPGTIKKIISFEKLIY